MVLCKTGNFPQIPVLSTGANLRINRRVTTLSGNKFSNRVVVITGASTGIGLATAQAFAAQGAQVALAARNLPRLQLLATELGTQFPNRILTVSCDVTDRAQVNSLLAQVSHHFGRIDILVNNAGIGLIAPFERVQSADAHALFATNFFGPFHCMQAVLPYFRQQRSGAIVNVASLAGLRGIPNSSVYGATKAALIALSDALRVEWKDYGIHFTVVCPGRVRLSETGFFDAAKKYGATELYHAPEITTAAVARALLDAVATHKRLVVLPLHSRITHRLHKFAPGLLDRILYRKMPRLDSSSP